MTNNCWCKTNLSLITTDFLCNNLNVGIKCICLCLINNLLFSGHLKKFYSLAIYLLIFTSLCFQTLYKVHKIFHPPNKRPKAQNQSIKMSCVWIQFNRFFICEVHRGAIEFGGELTLLKVNFSLFLYLFTVKVNEKNITLMWKLGGLCLYICLWFQKEQQFYPRKKFKEN